MLKSRLSNLKNNKRKAESNPLGFILNIRGKINEGINS